jgi:hypothetical protein
MPGQSVTEMVDTLIHLMGRRVLIGPSVYYPCPGTALFELCKQKCLLPAAISQWRSSAMPIETTAFDRLDIATLFRLARVINFIKGRMDKDELDEGLTWRGLGQVLKDHGKEKDPTWPDLLLLLINERSFFSLRADAVKKASFLKVASSRRVLDHFFKNAWDEPILKSRAD